MSIMSKKSPFYVLWTLAYSRFINIFESVTRSLAQKLSMDHVTKKFDISDKLT